MITSLRLQDDPADIAAIRERVDQFDPMCRLELLAELLCREALLIAQEGGSQEALGEAGDFVANVVGNALDGLALELEGLAKSSPGGHG